MTTPGLPTPSRTIARSSSTPAEKRTTSTLARLRIWAAVAGATLLLPAALASAQTAMPAGTANAPINAAPRDGQRDFDWMVGTWKGHLRRLQHPLSGSTTWIDYDVVQVTRTVMDGRAVMDEFTAESPTTHARVDGLTLRLYNPETREWSIYWANMKNGSLAMPPTVGRFADGRGEFFDHEEFEGRQIVVRFVWSDITPTSAKFEQSFSADGGKTWEPNWISTITRVKD